MFKGCAGSQGACRDERDTAATLKNPQLVKHGSLIVREKSGLEENETGVSECVYWRGSQGHGEKRHLVAGASGFETWPWH